MNTILGLIPARGGSKGIPRKNIKLLAGKPLIAWTIEAALDSSCFARLIVSTDDAEIASVARQYGAEVPFLRPAELASDAASSMDVVLHGLDWLAQAAQSLPGLVMLLQPTSPLRTPEDIQAAITLQTEKNAEAVVSVCEAAHPVQWLRRLGPEGELLPYQTDPELSRRQDPSPCLPVERRNIPGGGGGDSQGKIVLPSANICLYHAGRAVTGY